MANDPQPEHSEELSLGYLSPEQYFNATIKAVENLRWQLVSADNYTVVCHTPGGDPSFGESVSISILETHAVFHSRSVNEYYWTDNQNIINAQLFKNELEAVIEKNKQVERNLKPINRAKLGALVPSKAYTITPILIYLNVLIFLIMVASGVAPVNPTTDSLLAWGANFRPLTMNGQWWRLFTYMFLHAGILHLLMNTYALLYIGMFLEPLVGKFRFASAYIITGICAGLLSVTMHPVTVAVGASGAIFGMYGLFFSMLTTTYIEKTARNTLLKSILFFIVLNLMNGMKENIDNAAHIGGLVSGVIIGYIYYPGLQRADRIKKQMGLNALIAAAVILLSVLTLRNLTDDFTIYQKEMASFVSQEAMALEVFKMDANAPKEDILYNIKERGIYYWSENIKILDKVDSLDLPATLKDKNKKLREYCGLRIDIYKELYQQVSDSDYSNANDMRDKSAKIEKLIQDIKSQ